VNLSESIKIFHEEKEPLEEVNLSDSFAFFDDNSTYHVMVKSLEGKVFNFNVEPIDYVDFIGIDAILSDYSNKNCDEIHMVEKAFLSKIEKVFVSSLGILMACGKSKARENHNKSTQKRGVWGFHNNHEDTPLIKSTMIIMGRVVVVKLRRDDWNELTEHPKNRGRDRPNSRMNSLQPGKDDVDQIAIKVHEDTPEDGDMLGNSMDRGTLSGQPISPFGPVAFQEASRMCRSIPLRTEGLLFSVPSGQPLTRLDA
jgi:predicted lactoylglutathione lyase